MTTLYMHGQVRIVATVENIFDILERIHCKESGHVGYKKTIAEVKHFELQLKLLSVIA